MLLFIVISGGIKRIAKTAELIVPFMTIGFIIMTVVVMIMRIQEVPAALGLIVSSAFGAHAILRRITGERQFSRGGKEIC